MLAIDITDNQIKLVEASVTAKISVKSSAARDLPSGCIENGRIVDMHIVAGEITDILVTEKIKEREATICINSGMILYKEIEIPKPKAGSEAYVIESIIQQEMNLGDEYNITYIVTTEVDTEDGPKLKVIAAACPQRIIDIYLELGRQVGLKTKLVVVSNGCITRLVRTSSAYKGITPMLLMQIDRSFININLYDKGEMVFSRYTKIDASDYEHSADYVNLAVFDNIFRTMHLVEQHRPDLAGQIKEIHYFGEIKDEKGLQKALQQNDIEGKELEFPADLVRSKRNFEFVEYANVIGALLKVDPKVENLNLLHTKEGRVKTLNMQFGLVVLIMMAIALVAVLGTWGTMQYIESLKKRELADLTQRHENMQVAEVQEYVNQIETSIEHYRNYSDAVDTARVLYNFMPEMSAQILDKLEEELLPGMFIIDAFEVDEYVLSVDFFCEDDTHPATYAEILEERGYFEDVRTYGYVNTEEDDEDLPVGYTFNITMRVKGGNRFE
ncbi:MAG: pilus assembly protein PilM [Oscillospiraceae bacterium]|nr:pilus assembly protein PilM [Oscillospiraceae bacterium]